MKNSEIEQALSALSAIPIKGGIGMRTSTTTRLILLRAQLQMLRDGLAARISSLAEVARAEAKVGDDFIERASKFRDNIEMADEKTKGEIEAVNSIFLPAYESLMAEESEPCKYKLSNQDFEDVVGTMLNAGEKVKVRDTEISTADFLVAASYLLM